MPSLNPRTPSPRPRINSGIFRPPNKISTTTRIISQWIGNSIKPPAPDYQTLSRQNLFQHWGNCVKLEYNTLVSGPARYALPVQIFKQGDRILSRNARKLLESGHGDSLALRLLVTRHFLPHFEQRVRVENQFSRNTQQLAFAQ